jgi:hypothetical protein
MDYRKIALTAVITWVVDFAYGMVVFGGLLAGEFSRYPLVFRSEASMMAMLPLMLVGSLAAMFVLAYIYAKGYEGGSGMVEGFRFGLLLALFITGFMSIGIYATFNVDGRLAMMASIATFLELLIDGTVMGLVYRPARVAVA